MNQFDGIQPSGAVSASNKLESKALRSIFILKSAICLSSFENRPRGNSTPILFCRLRSRIVEIAGMMSVSPETSIAVS